MPKPSLALAALVLLSAPAAERKSFTVQSMNIAWQPMHIPGFPEGLQQRLLHDNKDNKLMSAPWSNIRRDSTSRAITTPPAAIRFTF